MRLVVVMVNYKTPDLVADCLDTLIEQLEPGKDIVSIVDNCSGDDSADQIEAFVKERGYEDRVDLIRSPVNCGFAGGNNVAIEKYKPDYWLLLNSDTLVRPNAIKELLTAIEKYPEVGIMSPRLEWPDETPQISCFNYLSPVSEFLASARTGLFTKLFKKFNVPIDVKDEPYPCQWTTFACALIRGDVMEQVGMLDDGYFMYFDDVDYCRRAGKKGWKVMNWPAARVVHLRGKSSPVKTLAAQRKRRPRYFFESRTRYFAKFYGWPGLVFTNCCWLVGRGVSFIREILRTKEPHTCERESFDIWINNMNPMRQPDLPAPPKQSPAPPIAATPAGANA